jgi:hypothetical protein
MLDELAQLLIEADAKVAAGQANPSPVPASWGRLLPREKEVALPREKEVARVEKHFHRSAAQKPI